MIKFLMLLTCKAEDSTFLPKMRLRPIPRWAKLLKGVLFTLFHYLGFASAGDMS